MERLSKLAIQQMEITPQERVVDMYFELLRTNRFDENTSIDNLDRAVNFFNVRLLFLIYFSCIKKILCFRKFLRQI